MPAANQKSRATRLMCLSSDPSRATLSPFRAWPATLDWWSKDLHVATTSSSNCCAVLEMLPGSYNCWLLKKACSNSM